MLIEIYEEGTFNSTQSDLDMLLDYSIGLLKNKGIEVKRYDKLLDPEKFEAEEMDTYKLPVIVVDGEILCAGAYDFTLLDRNLLNKNSNDPTTCGGKSDHCASCPSRGACHKA